MIKIKSANLFFCLLVLLSFVSGSSLNAKTENYIVNPAQSKVQWEGKKLSGSHDGAIRVKKGMIRKKAKSLTGKILIDMNSISCDDIKDKDYNKKLVDHLKSKDFFHVLKYKTAKLKIREAKRKKGNQYIVSGKIIIRGISQKIKFPAEINFTKNEIQAKGKIKIDRTKFNIRYNSAKFFKSLGDKLIYDDFIIRFSIRAALSV